MTALDSFLKWTKQYVQNKPHMTIKKPEVGTIYGTIVELQEGVSKTWVKFTFKKDGSFSDMYAGG